MKNSLCFFLLIFSSVYFHQTSYADDFSNSEITNYQKQAKKINLANDQNWQRLLYFSSPTKPSKVDYNKFFLHPKGNTSPELELQENIAALFTQKDSDQAFVCRFPARSDWLIKQLQIPKNSLPTVDCPEFDEWFNAIQPHKTTLIFATDFMGNPSSMFGHTLLRIDPKDQAELNLVSYAINYAATPETQDGDFAYAWKGLTGKYPSAYSLMPYYHKVKEYGDLESRDLWEYELNLSPEKTQFLVKHIWELQNVHFPYYFISDNCSYALLGLFDILEPELNLQQQFSYTAIPIETIKALQDAKLIKDMVYRPALETQLLSQVKQHGKTLAQTAHRLAYLSPEQMPEQLTTYSTLDQAKILEMAYDDLYLALIARRVDSQFAQPRLRSLLGQRSRLDISKQRQAPQEPKFNPLQGHHARNLSISAGQAQKQNIVELEHRQAYHDLIDPTQGYRFGTQLIFLQGKAQIREEKLKLEQLSLMSVNSFNPINPFKAPLSWGMSFGWQQESLLDGKFDPSQQHGVINTNAQAGYSIADMNQKHLCYAQVKGYLQAGQVIDKGWRVGAAPTMGCLNQWSDKIQSVIQTEIPYWLEQNKWNLRIGTQWQYAINTQNAIRLNWQYQQQEHKDWQKWSLGYVTFFK